MKIKLILFAILPLLISCQEKFDGTSEKTFIDSRKIIEEKLSDGDKSNLENALRVITLSAMYQKFNDSNLEENTFDDILLKEVNGKTYKDVVKIAEKFLKEDRDRKIEQIQSEIRDLENIKSKYFQLKSKLDQLEAKPVKIDLVNDFLIITCAFTNNSNETITSYGTQISYSSNNDEFDGWNCSFATNDGEIAPNETKLHTCNYDLESAKNKSKIILWDKIKYPITDFAKYNMVVECQTVSLSINHMDYELGGMEFNNEAEINLQNKKKELEEHQQQKGTLDELVLTKE